MAGIFGDGQRGGIFGARVDPRLLQMALEQRAEAERQRQAAEQSTISSRAQDWWNKSTFFKPAWDDLVGGLTAPGDVMSGAQPTMVADPQTGEFHTDPRLADRAMNAAGMLTLGAGAVPAEANSLRMGIKAYHGSPHDFERFDSSKIGTGEGAQAYGHGLYFAENEGVAKSYRQPDLYSNTVKVNVGGRPLPESLSSVEQQAAGAIRHKMLTWSGSKPIDWSFLENSWRQQDPEVADVIRNWAKQGIERKSGSMYEVDIAADPEHFLDWDKPLSEQSPQVREQLRKGGILQGDLQSEMRQELSRRSQSEDEHVALQNWYEELSQQAKTADDDALDKIYDQQRVIERWWDEGLGGENKGSVFDPTGEAIHRQVAERLTSTPNIVGSRGKPDASQMLREAGIPGIKYLDQGSRDPQKMKELADDLAQYKEAAKHWAETGNSEKLAIAQKQIEVLTKRISETRNYVVFPGNEHLISILKKYGLPISAAGLAALSQLHPEEAQAAQRKPPAARK
jgi:hypothetical protein